MNWKKHKLPALLMLMIVVYSCASMGTPDGGPYDEEPPKFVRSSPKPYATNNKDKKIAIEFDEFIKLEKTSEKVVVSPPQLEQPDIKASGRRVLVNLMDSLKPNTTYTIDFSDAIVDNNEGNPLGNYSFSFSTGETIDTLEVSGTVLAAADLEPVKGMMVGLHVDLDDSAFAKKPFDRVSRTDSRGRFTIRGIAPGKYHIFGLMDGNQNYLYTDTLNQLVPKTDTIELANKLTREQREKLQKKANEEKEKERKKREKSNWPTVSSSWRPPKNRVAQGSRSGDIVNNFIAAHADKIFIMKLQVRLGCDRYLLQAFYGFYLLYIDMMCLEQTLVES